MRFAATLGREWILTIVLVGLVIGFAPIDHFLSLANLLDLTRHLAEIGLIACGMTLIVMTGGIDLSVGSLLCLCGIVFGYSWMEWQLGAALSVLLMAVVGTLVLLVLRYLDLDRILGRR